MLGKYILKSLIVISELKHSFFARVKITLIGSIGSGFKCEGRITFSAITGNIEIGHNVRLGSDVRIGVSNGAKIIIGNNVSINQGTVIIATESIVIKDNCRIGEYCSIRDNDHEWQDRNRLIREQGFKSSPVIIEDDVWIGRGAVITKGVRVGRKSIIGASSFVNKNVEDFEISVGIPNRKISNR